MSRIVAACDERDTIIKPVPHIEDRRQYIPDSHQRRISSVQLQQFSSSSGSGYDAISVLSGSGIFITEHGINLTPLLRLGTQQTSDRPVIAAPGLCLRSFLGFGPALAYPRVFGSNGLKR